jgi:predicted DsbA family dithiol-disulfide isomerase
VIDERYGVAGAQEPEVFAGALRQVAAEREAVR